MKETDSKKAGHSGIAATVVGSVSDKIYSGIKKSVLGRFLRSSDEIKNKTSRSLILNSVRNVKAHIKDKLKKQPKKVVGTEELGSSVGIYNEDTIHRTFKKRFRSSVESSVVLNGFHKLVNALLSLPVMSLGIYMLAFGIAVTAIQTYELFATEATANGIIVLSQGLLILLLSLPALMNRDESIYDCFRGSVFGNFTMFSMMGAERVRPRLMSTDKHYGFAMFLLGVLSGALTLRFSVTVIIVSIVIGVCALRTVYMPEFGVVCIIGALPLYSLLDGPEIGLAVSVLYVAFCYTSKALVGKRSFSFVLGDFFVLMFGVVVSITSAGRGFGGSDGGDLIVYICFIIGYFVVRNLIVSSKWIERCLVAFIASSYFVSVFAVIQWLGERIGFAFITFFDDVTLAVYIGVSFIVTLARFLTSRRYRRAAVFILGVQLCALLISGSRIALVFLIVSLIAFMAVRTKKTVSFLLLSLLLIPVAYCLFSSGDLDQLHTLVTFSSQSQETKVGIWRVTGDIIDDYLLHGIGVGDNSFAALFDYYCQSPLLHAENSRSLLLQMVVQTGLIGSIFFVISNLIHCIGAFTVYCKAESDRRLSTCAVGITFALAFMLLYGVFEYVWINPAIMLLFWMLIGLSASCTAISDRVANKEYNYLEDTSTDVSIVFD